MVFKMLKGFGRLVLTTAVLCSVGLFLCGNVVKADPTIDVDAETGDVTVKYHNETSSPVVVHKVIVTVGGSAAKDITKTLTEDKTVAADATEVIYKFLKSDLVESAKPTITGPGDMKITKVEVKKPDDSTLGDYTATNPVIATAKTIRLQKSIVATNYPTSLTSYTLDTFTIGERPYKSNTEGDYYVGYGIKGEPIVIKTAGIDGAKYYECIGDGTEKWDSKVADKAVFISPDAKNATVGEADFDYKIQYFPKVSPITLTNGGDKTIYLRDGLTAPDNVAVEFNALSAVSGTDKDNAVVKSNVYVKPVLTIAADGNIKPTAWSSTPVTNTTKGEVKFSGAVLVADTAPGRGVVSVKAVNKDGGDSPLEITSTGTINVLAYAPLKDITLSSTTVSMLKSSSQSITVSAVSPAGADPAIWERVGVANVSLAYTDTKKVIDQVNTKIGNVSGKNGLQIASLKKIGTGTITLSFKVPETGNTITKNITVNVVEDSSIDAEKSVKNINGSDKNYITVGYELDLKSLVISSLVSGEGKAIPKDVRPEYVDSISWEDSDKASKIVENVTKLEEDASKGKIKGKAEGTVTFDAILDDGTVLEGITVSVYPMPSVKYGTDDHKLTVTVPAKVSTGYGDTDTNINSGKGFKLVMEDSSGNALYEYDKTKFQSVISSVKDFSTAFAVAAADVEAMVTNASTNGKFTGDTQVKFKVVPMGYKQSTASEMITAKDEVNAKTDGVQVYQLSSTGANFANSYAYGLAGQTVNLTATPNTGFTFSKWTDGVTSNPRSIRVEGSGTRVFTPEAKESTPGAGGDNSGLYDDVPKTAESNVAIWLIVFMVFAVMGTAYALYLQLRAATSKNGK